MALKRLLNVYQSINELVFNALSPANANSERDASPSPVAADGAAIDEDDARQFLRFEAAFPKVSGLYDQLNLAARKRNADDPDLDRPGIGVVEQASEPDDGTLQIIEQGLKDEILVYSNRIRPSDQVPISVDPELVVSEYVNSIQETGQVSKASHTGLLPSSTQDLRLEVDRRTEINRRMERCHQVRFSSSLAVVKRSHSNQEPIADEEPAANVLYEILAERPACDANEHSALLQLSGFSDAEQKTVFKMFLSRCPGKGEESSGLVWHETVCALETSPPVVLAKPPNICKKLRLNRNNNAPLHLSFTNCRRLWKTEKSQDFPSDEKTMSLETLLAEKEFQSSDPTHGLRKYQLASQLASSLHQLYPGPWIQKPWDARYVEIVRRDDQPEAYVRCVLTNDRTKIISLVPGAMLPDAASQSSEDSDSESEAGTCPYFILSFAQLLVDIAKGQTGHRQAAADDSSKWQKLLVEEVKKSFQDDALERYRKAIVGCLQFAAHYDTARQRTKNNKEQMVRDVIQKYILLHLQENVSYWEQMNPLINTVEQDDQATLVPSEAGRPGSARAWQPSRNGRSSRDAPEPRPPSKSEFTLWLSQDWQSTILANRVRRDETLVPVDSQDENSFTARMKEFHDNYIRSLPKAGAEANKLDQNIRVAIIDTGFHLDSDKPDPVLLAYKDRVVGYFHPDASNQSEDDWKDNNGHGTHVARLVLTYAPRAEIIVAKISDSGFLEEKDRPRVAQALRWAGENADIINLSWGLGRMADDVLEPVITDLVQKRKLIFAAASNGGGYGGRSWPANHPGVFCVHATNELGGERDGLNPEPETGDNFATLGVGIESFWNGKYTTIQGTSFAAPIAAAVAANILEFCRRAVPKAAESFNTYGIMRNLFRHHMTLKAGNDRYHLFKPWAPGLWDGIETTDQIRKKLTDISIRLPESS